MVLFSRLNNKAILVGLEDGEAIIKPLEPGDDALSFESLYDDCISLREYRKVQALKVRSPTEFPPSLYEADILLTEINMVPAVRLRVPAKGDVDARNVLRALVDRPDFREQLVRRFVMQLMASDDVALTTRGALRVTEVAPEGTQWEFLDDET